MRSPTSSRAAGRARPDRPADTAEPRGGGKPQKLGVVPLCPDRLTAAGGNIRHIGFCGEMFLVFAVGEFQTGLFDRAIVDFFQGYKISVVFAGVGVVINPIINIYSKK